MVTQRADDVANDNDDAMADVVAMQPAASEDDVMQRINGSAKDVILIPEAMVDGMY